MIDKTISRPALSAPPRSPRAKGMTHRVDAWVHPAGGDDYLVSLYVNGAPTKSLIQKELKKLKARFWTTTRSRPSSLSLQPTQEFAMPLILIPLLFAVVLFFAPIAAAPAVISVAQLPIQADVVELHYTRSGIVRLNRTTGATRFTPYRMAGDLDRRRENRIA